jgi:Xaa-Pro aminopeptidase
MGLNTSNRLTKLRQKLAEKELDGILISQPENRFYLSGFHGSAGYLFITAKDAVLATDFRYIEQVKIQAPDYRIFQITGKLEEWFPKLVGELNTKQLGFESGDVTFAFHHQLTDTLNKAEVKFQLVPVEGLVESIRTIKEPEEMALIAQAVEISDSAFVYIVGKIHLGMTEKEVAWEIEKFMREHDSQSVPFEPIVAAGPNSALPHARPSLRPIKAGEPVVIDIGARVSGYASDLTRTICLGKPDDTFKKVYDTVLGAQLAALALIKEGMTGEMADNLARTVIKEAGYGEAFGHALGHGVGLAPHEPPRLGPNSTEVLTSGMVFSVEPGIYLPGWGGVRIEDLVVIEKGQLKVLSKASKTT